jgi:rubrerythrin
MHKTILSLNFMHCMERLATQIYRTQIGAFPQTELGRQLDEAAGNEQEHVRILRAQIHKLGGGVYPLGALFQFAGVILGRITRLSGRRNLLGADIFVEIRAAKDYRSFLHAVRFDAETAALLRQIIGDEERHILNWRRARAARSGMKAAAV